MRTESRLVMRGRRRARSSSPQRCLADPPWPGSWRVSSVSSRHGAARRDRRRVRARVVHHLRGPAQGRAREPGRMVRDDGQAAAHAVAVAPDPVRRGPPLAVARIAVHLRLLRGHVDVVGARAPRVAARLPDPLPQDDAEVDAHGHERAIEDVVPDGDGRDRGHGARRHRRRRPPIAGRAAARAAPPPPPPRARAGGRFGRSQTARPSIDAREEGAPERHAPPTRERHQEDERDQHGDRAHHVRGQERGVIREVREQRGQEAGADRGCGERPACRRAGTRARARAR